MQKYEVVGARINVDARPEVCRVLRDTVEQAFAAKAAMIRAGYSAKVKLVNIGHWQSTVVK